MCVEKWKIKCVILYIRKYESITFNLTLTFFLNDHKPQTLQPRSKCTLNYFSHTTKILQNTKNKLYVI